MLELRFFSRVWNDDVAVYAVERGIGDRNQLVARVARAIEFEEIAEGGLYGPNPTFSISMETAQRAMDELWSCGIRPTQGKQSEGMFTAQGRHLDDMRAIAFAKLNIKQGE